jgi:hypothetical protein
MLKIEYDFVEWTYLAQDSDKLLTLVDTVMNFPIL